MPRKNLRTLATLPAAAAWDSPDTALSVALPEAAATLGLEVVAQRAPGQTGGGAVSVRLETLSEGAAWSRVMATNTGAAVVTGTEARVPVVDLVFDLPAPTDDQPVRFVLPLDPGPGAKIRVLLQERGAPAQAGSASCALVWRVAR